MTARSQLRHKQALALVVIVAGLAPTGVVAGSRYARSTPGKLKADIGAHSHGRGATAMGSVRDQVEPDGISKARGCTMAVPPARATVEATIANASDFCELVSHALATNVFRHAGRALALRGHNDVVPSAVCAHPATDDHSQLQCRMPLAQTACTGMARRDTRRLPRPRSRNDSAERQCEN